MQQLKLRGLLLAALAIFIITGCGQAESEMSKETIIDNILRLPELEAANLNGRSLKVIATTSIIGDVVAQVGGDAIELTTLIQPGQDPHSYEPGAQELTAVSDADVIFVNGWDLEETLVSTLESIGKDVPIVPVSANIQPLALGSDDHDHDHDLVGVDPHTWFDVQNVAQWVENIEISFSQLDPTHAESYAQHADAYHAKLNELDAYAQAELDTVPAEKRFLVTNHDALGYLAHTYGLEVVGTVIPGSSTLAEPSARDIATLVAKMEDHDVCTIFTETTISDTLAKTTTAELDGCDAINVIPLYTGSLSPKGSDADNYIGMIRANIDAIVDGLK